LLNFQNKQKSVILKNQDTQAGGCKVSMIAHPQFFTSIVNILFIISEFYLPSLFRTCSRWSLPFWSIRAPRNGHVIPLSNLVKE
jgi:hypothetical protein